MWKAISKLLQAGIGLALLLPGTAGAFSPGTCWNGDGAARVWPEVIFRRSADLGDYRRTLAQSRDEVRQMLEQEYVGMVGELAQEFENPEELLEPVLAALLAFDAVHDRHKEQAAMGIPVYVEMGVRSALDRLYRFHRIPDERRRLRFATVDLAHRLDLARAALDGDSTTVEHRNTLRQVAAAVDMVAYATLAADGETHHLTLTLENLHSGELCDFAAAGPLEEMNWLLSETVFRSFQAVSYPETQNPNPHLTWIRPGTTAPISTAEQALHYCTTQGARLPYALELVTAAQVGATDAAYVEGGIPRLDPGLWAVADRQRSETHLFYFEPLRGALDTHPSGPVRTTAGLGPVRARYWCVQGDPEPRVTRIEDLYATYRWLHASVEADSAAAVEYLLNRENALGARQRFARAYPSDQAAWEQVWQAGCLAGIPPAARLLAANRPAAALRCEAPDPSSEARHLARQGNPAVN